MFWTGVLNVGIVVFAALALTLALRMAARADARGRRPLVALPH